MSKTNFKDLLESGVHFGHLTRKWNPKMAPYIFMEKNGIHVIDLNKTIHKLDQACAALKHLAKSGRKIMFVATKKQAKESVSHHAKRVNMPYITERWSGGLLTNFATIRKAIKKMNSIDKMNADGTIDTLSKRERLQVSRTRDKLEKNLGSIASMNRIPAALFIVDIHREHIAVAEAKKLGIPTFAIVDTNSDPNLVDFCIPGNDDASRSIEKIVSLLVDAIQEGLNERNAEKEVVTEKEDVSEKEVVTEKEDVSEKEHVPEKEDLDIIEDKQQVSK